MSGFTQGRDDTACSPKALGTRRRRLKGLSGHDVALVNGPVFLVGLFYAVSPYVLGFAGTHHDLAVHDLVVGGAICLLAVGFTVVPERMTGLSAALAVTGVWMAVTPWWVGRTPSRAAGVGGVVLGCLALFLGVLAAALVRRANRLP